MDLKTFLSILQKRIWLVTAIPLISVIVVGYISFFIMEPLYESTTSLYVINKQQDPNAPIEYDDMMVSKYLVEDYRELIMSNLVTSTVIQDLNLKNLSAQNLSEMIKVQTKNDTRVIQIKILDKDPVRASQIANKISAVFVEKVVQLMKVENVSIIDSATVTNKPVKPNPVINIAIAVMLGFCVSFGIVFVMEYMDDTVKTSDDVEKLLNLMVLGTIPSLDSK